MSIRGNEPESPKYPYVCGGEALWSRNEGTLNERVTRTVISCIKENLLGGNVERVLSPGLATQISRSIEALDDVAERKVEGSDLDLLAELLLVLQDETSSKEKKLEAFEDLPSYLQRVMIGWTRRAYPEEEPISFLTSDPIILLTMVDSHGNNVIENLIEAVHTACDYDQEAPAELTVNHQLISLRQQVQSALYSQLARSIVRDRFPRQMQTLLNELKELTDRRLIREIVKECAIQDLQRLAKHIELFPVLDEEERAILITHCLPYGPLEMINHFRYFKITSQQTAFEIGKELVKREPLVIYHIEKLGLTDEQMQLELYRLTALYHPVDMTTLIKTSGMPLDETMQPIALLAYAGTMFLQAVLDDESYVMVLKQLEGFRNHLLVEHFFPMGLDQSETLEDKKDIGLLYLLFTLAPKELEPGSFVERAVLEIEKYGHPQLTPYVYQCLLREILPNHVETLRRLQIDLKPHLMLPLIPIAALQANSQIDGSRLNEFLKPKRIQKSFHDSKLLQPWLLALEALDKGDTLSVDRKLSLMLQATEHLNQQNPIGDLITRLTCLYSLPSSLLNRDFTENMTEELNQLVEASIKTDPFLDVQGIDHFEDKYNQTFARSNDPNAWRAYMKSLKRVKTSETRPAFNLFFREVLEGTLERMRYEREDPHTLKIKENHGKLWKKWQSLSTPRELSLSTAPEMVSFLFRNQLLSHWKAGHTKDSAGQERLTKLSDYFQQPDQVLDILKICGLSLHNPIDEVQQDLIRLCELKSSDPVDIVTLLRKILVNRSALCSLEILRDLEDMLATYSRLVDKKQQIVVQETDRWQQILVCGAGVGSCLRVDGAGKYNRGLLGYLLEGKNHLLAITDLQTGKILARCVLRVMWDATRQCPALLQEKTYPNPRPAAFEHALNEFAKQRALQLDCRLYVAEPREDTSLSGVTLESLGGVAPDYSDANAGVSFDGKFELTGLYRVRLLTS